MEETPSTPNSRAARGEGYGGASVERGDVYSRELVGKSAGKTGWFGMNLSASALGVSWVCINIVLAVRSTCVGNVAAVWHSEWRVGRLLACDDVRAGILADLLYDRVCDCITPFLESRLSVDSVLGFVGRNGRQSGRRGFIFMVCLFGIRM